jgi:hypothetical protein
MSFYQTKMRLFLLVCFGFYPADIGAPAGKRYFTKFVFKNVLTGQF